MRDQIARGLLSTTPEFRTDTELTDSPTVDIVFSAGPRTFFIETKGPAVEALRAQFNRYVDEANGHTLSSAKEGDPVPGQSTSAERAGRYVEVRPISLRQAVELARATFDRADATRRRIRERESRIDAAQSE